MNLKRIQPLEYESFRTHQFVICDPIILEPDQFSRSPDHNNKPFLTNLHNMWSQSIKFLPSIPPIYFTWVAGSHKQICMITWGQPSPLIISLHGGHPCGITHPDTIAFVMLQIMCMMPNVDHELSSHDPLIGSQWSMLRVCSQLKIINGFEDQTLTYNVMIDQWSCYVLRSGWSPINWTNLIPLLTKPDGGTQTHTSQCIIATNHMGKCPSISWSDSFSIRDCRSFETASWSVRGVQIRWPHN